jgi:hypothetical protein
MFLLNKLEVRNTQKGKGLFSTEVILKDQTILEFEKNYIGHHNNKTLQIDENKHQISKNPDAIENFINHSCQPNAYINFKDLTFRAKHKIGKGEELTYNYFTTDWDNEDVFQCKCGRKNCKKLIKGFRNLVLQDKKKLRPLLSPYLLRKLGDLERQPAY